MKRWPVQPKLLLRFDGIYAAYGPATMSALPPAAERLLASQQLVLDRWVEQVRQHIGAANDEARPVLIDTFPAFITHLAEALDPHHPRTTATKGTTIAGAHGSERSRTTNYRLRDVIRELQLLRDVVLDVLGDPDHLSKNERQIIVASIDESIGDAASAFSSQEGASRELLTLTLSHDLRQPLTAARTGIELVIRRPDSPDVARWAGLAGENIGRIDRMIRDLLDATASSTGTKLRLTDIAEVDLVSIARGCVEELHVTHGECCVVKAPARLLGYWSASALARAIDNLLANAIKYGTNEEPVTVTVRQTEGRAMLSVHNHGSHVPEADQAQLFQPFKRTETAKRTGVQSASTASPRLERRFSWTSRSTLALFRFSARPADASRDDHGLGREAPGAQRAGARADGTADTARGARERQGSDHSHSHGAFAAARNRNVLGSLRCLGRH